MGQIYKICLFISIFIATSSIAWAGLNYDSAHNYFLIDSLLKPGGNYFLIGDAFDEIPDSFAVSNNLIFFKQGGLFKSSDNVRQMGLNIDGSFLTTNAITVKAANNDFEIISPSGSLNIKGNKINMNKDFIINKGLTLVDDQQPGDNNIYVDTVLTDNIELFNNTSPLIIKAGKEIDLAAGGTAEAASIVYEDGGVEKDFCNIKTWNVTESFNNANSCVATPSIYLGHPFCAGGYDVAVAINSCVGGDTSYTAGTAKRTCCDQGYFLFDFDATAGKMICCRFRQ